MIQCYCCVCVCVCLVCSIEDAKQKTEHDRRVKQAEMRKQSVRKEIGRLRRTFLQLVQRNAQLTQPLQLPANEFIMDPSLEENMKKQAQQQVQCVCVCVCVEDKKEGSLSNVMMAGGVGKERDGMGS